MKKNFGQKIWTKIFFGVQTCIKENLVLSYFPRWGVGWGSRDKKIKVAQNGVKHVLILEFLRSDEILEILCAS